MRRSADNASHPDEDTTSLQIETEGRGRMAERLATLYKLPLDQRLKPLRGRTKPSS
jgi:hypothetical protein